MPAEIAPTETAQPAKTDDEKAKAAASAPAKPKGPFVKYLGPETGSGTLADISAAHWASVGITAKREQTSVWHLENEWRLPADYFSDEQLDQLLNVDKRFVLVDASGDPVDR